MAEKLETVRFPVMVYDYLKAERDAFNKTRKAGQKLSLANFVRLKYDELKSYQNVSMAQPAPAAVVEKPAEDIKPAETPVEDKGVNAEMGDCPNCTAREIEMKRVKEEVIPALQKEASKRETELVEKVAALTIQLTDAKATASKADAIPEDMDAVIEHCESGQCANHAAWWQKTKADIIEANQEKIVQHTLENLPDSIVESEGLKRGFIPTRITIPMASSRARR